jgi:hypothetical protein
MYLPSSPLLPPPPSTSSRAIHMSTSTTSLENQPDLLKEVLLAQSLKPSRTENDLECFKVAAFKSKSFESERFGSLRWRKTKNSLNFANNEEEVVKTTKKKSHRQRLARSCISQ